MSKNVHAQIIYQDKMVYKVAQSVFSIKDLKKDFVGINTLGCMYGDSLLLNIFSDEFKKENTKFFELTSEFSQAQKEFFIRLIQFSNLKVYAKSQPVIVDPNIVKFLYLNAKENKCDRSVFKSSKELTDSFEELLKLEIFVRSRFLPTEKGGRTTADDLKKAVSSAKNLLNSIGRQIDNELYW